MNDNDDSHDDDTLLSAYIDGELPAAEADRITERLAREPLLMRRLEALRAGDTAVRDAFERLDAEPMPAAVLDMLGAKPGKPADNVVAFPARGARRFLQVPVALAASIALVAGFVVSNVLRDAPGMGIDLERGGAVASTSPLYGLLEHGVSGEAQVLASGTTGEVVLTFEDRGGDWCRQVAVASGPEALHGVACRRDGGWQVEALGYAPAGQAGGVYLPAGSDTPEAVDAAIDGLIGSADPLDASEENRVISEGWKKSSD